MTQNRSSFLATSADTMQLLPSFSRRKSRGFTSKQKQLMLELLPKLTLDIVRPSIFDSCAPDHGATCTIADSRLNNTTSKESSTLEIGYLEIGFGCGEHILELSSLYPNELVIGCEVFLNGVVSLLAALDANPRSNIAIYIDDARKLIEILPTNSVGTTYVLFPDPWPKSRHRKRRLISEGFLHSLARVSKKLIVATDHEVYAGHMMIALNRYVAPSGYRQSNNCMEWQGSLSEHHELTPDHSEACRHHIVSVSANLHTYTHQVFKNLDECVANNVATRYARKALYDGRAVHYFEVIF